MKGSDYLYPFHTPILRANQKICAEALDLFKRENTFISIIFDDVFDNVLRPSGVAVLAEDTQARAFPATSMTIAIDVDESEYYTNSSRATRRMSLFLLEDLPAACVSLQHQTVWHNSHSRNLDFHITLNRHLGDIPSLFGDGLPVPGSKLWKCLDPLRNIRGANFVSIDGLADISYTTAIMAKLREGPLDSKKLIAMIEAQLDQGDQALLGGDLVSAIDIYKATLNTVRACSLNEDEQHEVIVSGRFQDIQAGR